MIRPALDLVSADVASQPDVSQPSVNGFGCGKVRYLGGKSDELDKVGVKYVGVHLTSYLTSYFFLHSPLPRGQFVLDCRENEYRELLT